jgi:hypothetical protein
MSIEREKLKALRGDMELALKDVGNKYGINFDVGRMLYTEDTIKVNVEGASTSTPGTTVIEKDFIKSCQLYGFKRTDLGRTFHSNDSVYRIKGIKKRNRKYPVIAERVIDGKSFKFPCSVVLSGLK